MHKGQKSWDYSHSEHSYPVVHVFMPGDTTFNSFPVLKQKLNNIQQVESNNHLRGGIINLYNSIDTSWIIASQKMGYRYAVVWFDGVWADTEDFNKRLLSEIDRINNSADKGWIVAGEIQEDRYAYFYRSLLIINLQTWLDNEQPNPFVEPVDLPGYFKLNADMDWEDSVFALYPAKYDDKPRSLEEVNEPKISDFGNSWIAWSLRRSLTVPGISEDLMQCVMNTRPHRNPPVFEWALQGGEYEPDELSHQAKRCINVLHRSSPIYFVNTEASKPEIVEQLEGTGFEQYVGPCAGFKLLYYAYKYGFNSDTRFVFYDFDEDSVQFKKDLFANWHGQDLVAWVDAWCKANPGKNTDLQYLVAERWPATVEMFGGQQSWLEFWNEVKKCDCRFIVADVVDSSDDRISSAMAHVRTLLWTSNIYSYILAKMTAKPFALEQSFINLVTKLNTFPDSWFVGTDINDNEIMCPSKAITSIGENYNIGFE